MIIDMLFHTIKSTFFGKPVLMAFLNIYNNSAGKLFKEKKEQVRK